MAAAYRYRPPYPPAVIKVLLGLVRGTPQHILDAGCGTGNLARALAPHADRVDAVDFSLPMIEEGRRLPGGDDPRIRWLHGRVEDVALDPPYALVVAGESLHWMDRRVVLPRFHQVLAPGAYLAIVTHETTPDPWSLLGDLVARYRTDGGYQPLNLLEELQRESLFQIMGAQTVGPVPFVQSIDDCIESYHARAGFSRQRMGAERSAAFDAAARQHLQRVYPDGAIAFAVAGRVVWGSPGGYQDVPGSQ